MKPFRCGRLSADNVERITLALTEFFRGKIFSHSIMKIGDHSRPELLVNQVIQTEWVDESNDLVKFTNDEFTTIYFSDSTYLNHYSVKDHQDKSNIGNPQFSFEHDGLRIWYKKFGVENWEMFRIQGDLPKDSDEYNESLLEAHYGAVCF